MNKMKLSALLLLSTLSSTDAFFKSHDIVTRDDGSIHLGSKTQYRKLGTKNLTNGKLRTNHLSSSLPDQLTFTVHGDEYVTTDLYVGSTIQTHGLELYGDDAELGENLLTNLAQKLAGTGLMASITHTQMELDMPTIFNSLRYLIRQDIFSSPENELLKQGLWQDIRLDILSSPELDRNVIFNSAESIFFKTEILSDILSSPELDRNVIFNSEESEVFKGEIVSLFSGTVEDVLFSGTVLQELAQNLVGPVIDLPASIFHSAESEIFEMNLKKDIFNSEESEVFKMNLKEDILSVSSSTVSSDIYRLEKMILLLCNTLGVKFEHLARAVDEVPFNPYASFSATQSGGSAYDDHPDANDFIGYTESIRQLCSVGMANNVNFKCFSEEKHALSYCAGAACADEDFGDGLNLDTNCCQYNNI